MLDIFFLSITHLGDVKVIFCLSIILIAALIFSRKQRLAFYFAIGLILGEAGIYILKYIFGRVRPPDPLYEFSNLGYAFPSGHAFIAIVFYGFAAYCLTHIFYKKSHRIIIYTLAGIVILAIGISRIYLGVHWVTDVIAGWGLGIIFLCLLIILFNKNIKQLPKKH